MLLRRAISFIPHHHFIHSEEFPKFPLSHESISNVVDKTPCLPHFVILWIPSFNMCICFQVCDMKTFLQLREPYYTHNIQNKLAMKNRSYLLLATLDI